MVDVEEEHVRLEGAEDLDVAPGRKWYEAECFTCHTKFHYHRGFRPELCPRCKEEFWDKPGLEKPLFQLQKKWLETRNRDTLGKMFPLLLEYAQNKIKKLIKDNGIYMTPTTFEDRSTDLCTKTFEVLLRNPHSKVDVSFGGLMDKVMKGVAYGDADHDKNVSLDAKIDEDGQDLSCFLFKVARKDKDGFMEDEEIGRVENVHYDRDNKETMKLSDDLIRIVALSSDVIRENHGGRTALLYLVGLHNRVSKKPEPFMQKFYDTFGNQARNNVEKGELVIFKYLQEQAHR